LFAIALISALLSGCGEKWRIDKVVVNSMPFGGADPIVPVTLFAPGPSGASTVQSVSIEVEITRVKDFADEIRGVVTTSFSDPSGHNSSGQGGFFFSTNVSRVTLLFLKVTCTKTSATTVSLDVRALNAGATLNAGVTYTGTSQASTSVGISVGTDFITGDSFPIGWNAPHPLAISCNRDNLIN
jgi:hypothetical protein